MSFRETVVKLIENLLKFIKNKKAGKYNESTGRTDQQNKQNV